MCITAKLIVEWQRLGPFSPDRHAPDALGMSASLRSLPKFGTRASLNRACRNLVPAFPQRSPPSLLTTAACGGLLASKTHARKSKKYQTQNQSNFSRFTMKSMGYWNLQRA